MAMHEQKYKILFKGNVEDSFNLDEVKKRTQIIFKLSDDKLEQFFSGKQFTLKENISLEDAKHYEEKLKNLGLITIVEPIDNVLSNNDNSHQYKAESKLQQPTKIKEESKKSSKLPLLILFLLLLLGGGYYYYQTTNNEQEHPQPLASPQQKIDTSNSSSQQEEEEKVPSVKDDKHLVIQECTSDAVVDLLKRILVEGIPQLLKQNNPSLTFTLMIGDKNQELMFDRDRNTRLCGVLAQYEIGGLDVVSPSENDTDNPVKPIVIYEVIYNISLEADNNIKLSTLKQSVVSSNIQMAPQQQNESKVKAVPQEN